jgi:uncharacterized membrane protein
MDYNNEYTDQLYTTTTSNPEAAAAAIAITGGVLAFSLIFIAIAYVIGAIFLGKIFKKAGVESWVAWVPFYNSWKMLEIGGQQGFWAVLAIIPIVNYVSVVFMYIAMYHIGKKLGKDGVFVLLAIFLPIVWLIWLAVDKSIWNDKASTAPSLHTPAPTVKA